MRALLVISLLAAGPLSARVIAVGPGADAQERVQLALLDAKDGDVVELAAGRYAFTDGLSLDASGVTVRGAGADQTVLSFAGQRAAAEGLLVTGSRVLLERFAVEDARGDAIKAKGSDRITFRDLSVTWTGGPKSSNGGYGIYPVASSNVLIERVRVSGASDAGIYVGQSRNIVVRNNHAEYNVAGIEIENSTGADVHGNTVTRNTGGILVFDLPNLPVMGGSATRVFNNRVVDNDTPNFAAAGNVVAEVPVGTGVMVMANRNIHVFANDIAGNATAAVMVVAYKKPFASPGYNPLPRDVVVRANRLGRNGFAPGFPGGAQLAAAVGGALPPVMWDGAAAYETGGKRMAEAVRVVADVPVLNLNLALATDAAAKARPSVGMGATAAIPEPAAVVLPADQPGGR